MSANDEKSWHTCLPDVPPAIPISSHMSHLPSLHLHTLPSTCHLDLPFRSPRTPKASYTIPSHAISQDIQFLQSFKSLTTLNIASACGVYWKREHVEALPNTLKSLSLNHTCLSADALLLIPTSCPALQHLSLRHTSTLTDTVLAQLLPHLHLKSLDLSYCDAVTSIQPILSTDHVSSLVSLSLAHTSCDDQALVAMRDAHMNERITSLSAAGLSITTQGIRTYLTSSHSSPLLHLNLAGCTALDDSAIEMVASTCGELLILDMSGMDGITDDAVTFLAAGCHKLIQLRHFDCDISDDSLFILMKANPKIRLINTMRRIDDDEFADDDTHDNDHNDEDQDGSGEEDGDDPEEEQQQNGDGDGEQDDWDRHLSELRIRSESVRLPSRPQ